MPTEGTKEPYYLGKKFIAFYEQVSILAISYQGSTKNWWDSKTTSKDFKYAMFPNVKAFKN